jgi:hypothetical protein
MMLRLKNFETRNVLTVKIPKIHQMSALKWSEIRRRIELYMREKILRHEEDNPSF